jgi:lysophospholipase L1-like esterase
MVLTASLGLLDAQTAAQPHWVATWTTPQPLIRAQPRPPAAGRGPGNPGRALTTNGFHNQTVRMVVHTSVGGSKVRIKLENSFGSPAVNVGAAHIALRDADSAIVPASDRSLTFSGRPNFTIGPGMVILSDPVDLAVPKQGDIAVSLYLPDETGPPASHGGLHQSYVSKEGNQVGAPAIPEPITTGAYFWLAGVDVLAAPTASLVVALGDSITEGFRSTPNENRTWPDRLATRLLANKSTAEVAVVNQGIGGNRLLRDGTGASAQARLDRDVFSQSGVQWMIVLETINDIGHSREEPAPAADLIAGFQQIVNRAHAFGIKVVGCTLPPYEGANYYSEAGETTREAVNTWIRTGGAFDAVADFAAATQQKDDPKKLRAEFDPGDHLHLNDAGYQAMADAFDLSIFAAKPAR